MALSALASKIMTLLPDGEETMGSIARLLSLHALVQVLGADLGRSAFEASRGMDAEPVKETKGALTKSITAFKSFLKTRMNGMEKWISLLATDVVVRVKLDFKRNNRYPKMCNIQHVRTEGKQCILLLFVHVSHLMHTYHSADDSSNFCCMLCCSLSRRRESNCTVSAYFVPEAVRKSKV